jgi:hypothetical protein
VTDREFKEVKMRKLMDQILKAQQDFVANAPDETPFRGPHYGVHIRMWNGTLGITLEADPGYYGIGTALSPEEAIGLGGALIRAAVKARADIEVTRV